MNRRQACWSLRTLAAAVLATALTWAAPLSASPQSGANLKFEISFPASAHAEAITGRVFVMLSRDKHEEPRLSAGSFGDSPSLRRGCRAAQARCGCGD